MYVLIGDEVILPADQDCYAVRVIGDSGGVAVLIDLKDIHTVLVQVDTHFRLGHFSLVWPDPIWYHYTD